MPDEEMNEQWDTQETAPEQQNEPPAEPQAAASQEEDIVGSRRGEVKPVRKMSAADFKVRAEPKPEPVPEVQDVVESRQPGTVEQAPPVQPATPPAQEAKPSVEPSQPPVQPPVQEKPVQEARPQPPVQPPVQEKPVQEARPQPPVQEKPVQEARPQPPAQPPVQERPVQEVKPVQERQPTPQTEARSPSQASAAPPIQEASFEEDVMEPPVEEDYEYTPYEPPVREPRRGLKRAAKEPIKYEDDDITPTKEGVVGALKGALSFFTLFKLNVGNNEMDALNKNFYISPVAGFIIGMVAALVGVLLFELNLGIAIAAVIVATIFILSKFLHFDGLADFGDGMIVSGAKEDHIRALKDTSIGAGGMGVALVVTLVTFAGLAELSLALTVFLLSMVVITAEVFAKNAMVAAAAFGKPGEGMAAKQVHNSDMITMFMSTAISAVLAILGYLVMGAIVTVLEVSMFYGDAYVMVVLTIAASAVISILAGWLIANTANRTFGYVNGDVLGATNEIARALVIIVAAIVISSCVLWL